MRLRSLLFVPGDNETKLADPARHGADALILDLEDAVAPARKAAARRRVHDFLVQEGRGGGLPVYVRINAMQSGEAVADLAAVMPGRPEGIVLPKCEPQQLRALDAHLLRFEMQHGAMAGGARVIALATETPTGVFEVGQYGGVSERLQALSWGSEDLAAALGAVSRGADGYEEIFRMAIGLCALGAAAAGVDAIDGACMEYRDLAVVERECRIARRNGFVGKLAIHPAQVPVINAAFTPSEAELAWARRVVDAFRDQPELGVIGIDGKVIDRPHLRLAERLLSTSANRPPAAG